MKSIDYLFVTAESKQINNLNRKLFYDRSYIDYEKI